jgi:hypothetical protein
MFLHKPGEGRSFDWLFVSAWQWLGEYETLDKMFYNLLCKQEVVAAAVTSTFPTLWPSSRTLLFEI